MSFLLIVGEAYARPLADELAAGHYDVSSLFLIAGGGAVMTSGTRHRLVELAPNTLVTDGLGGRRPAARLST
ncbi:MAG: hypothetical protein ACM3ML_07665 [Micromonosporaceae bacterium]